MSTVRYFRWDDPGAPTLTGEVGSLTNLLRKCLVGVSGVAYGAKASAGWQEKFIGAATNIAVFSNNAEDGGSGCHVRVADSAAGGGGARDCAINIYAGMTDVNTGVLGSAAVYFRKSGTLSSAARPWFVVADGRTVWMQVWNNGDDVGYLYNTSVLGFGDVESFYNAANTNRYFIIGRLTDNSSYAETTAFRSAGSASNSFQVANPAGSGMEFGSFSPKYGSGFLGFGNASTPALLNGNVVFSRDNVVYSGTNPVGTMRGVFLPLTSVSSLTPGSPVGDSDLIILGGSSYAGGTPNNEFRVGIDTHGPW